MDPKTPRSLRSLNQVLGLMRTVISPVVPIQVAQAFISVALNEGKSLTEIAQICGGNLSTTSRHLLDLTEVNRLRAPGYGLVVRDTDPYSLAKNNYRLSPKGQLLINQLTTILEG